MIQSVIVIAAVTLAVFFAFRRVLRTLKGRGGCSCSCPDCPHRGCCSQPSKTEQLRSGDGEGTEK